MGGGGPAEGGGVGLESLFGGVGAGPVEGGGVGFGGDGPPEGGGGVGL